MTAPPDKRIDEPLLPLLADPQKATAHLDAVIELEDPTAVLLALRQVAKAHGMAEVARLADVRNKTLFRALH